MIFNVTDSTGAISGMPSVKVYDNKGRLKHIGGGGPPGVTVWGTITGTITAQTDLITYLSSNYTPLTRNITINGVTQDLSADRTWTIAGGGTVTSVQLAAGTGISLSGTNPIITSGTITVTNSAPDQTVVLTAGTGISISGTYPSFTISNTYTDGIPFAVASGTDTYTATIAGVTSYADGDAYLIRFTNGNTDASTLNINSLGAIPLHQTNQIPLIGGDIWDGGEMLCIYNATDNSFECVGTSPNSLFAYVTNDQGSTITKGQAVYAFSGTGNRMTVKLAKADADSTSAQTIGVVYSTSIAANQKGIIIIQGYLTGLSVFPTATWSDGDPIYLSPTTAGAFTKTKPLAPNHLVYCGVLATASNGSAGRMYVRIQNGYEMDELHDVASTGAVNNDILYRDTTVTPNLWKPASIATILGYTPVATTRTISTTSPLTGGGDLSADRTLSIPAATSSVNGYLTSTDWTNFNTAYTNRITSLTTTGTSGAATLSSNTLNVPNYSLSDLSVISVSTSNAREDDYAPTGWPGTTDRVKVINIDSTNTNYMMSLGGLASPTAGRVVTIVNASTANNLIIIENLSTSSTAANRFRMTNNMAYFLLPTRSVTFIYDGTYWTQMSASLPMGLDYFDDCTSAGSTVVTGFTGSVGLSGLMATGAGTGVRAEGDSFGSYSMSSGTTSTGYTFLSMQTRRVGGNNSFALNSTFPYLVVGRLFLSQLGTALQDFQVTFGISGAGPLGNTTQHVGYSWYYNGSANSFWDNRSQNVAGTVSTVASPLAANTSYNILGIYKPGGSNIRDAVYFYSTDAVIYQVSSKFVGTAGNYGGSPTFGLASTVGTTAKEIRVDYYGGSFNLVR